MTGIELDQSQLTAESLLSHNKLSVEVVEGGFLFAGGGFSSKRRFVGGNHIPSLLGVFDYWMTNIHSYKTISATELPLTIVDNLQPEDGGA